MSGTKRTIPTAQFLALLGANNPSASNVFVTDNDIAGLDNVEEFANLAAFPVTGITDKIYIAADTNKIYRWDGAAYQELGDGTGVAGTNLGYTASPTNGTVTSDTGTDATVPLVDGVNAGLMIPADKTKLDGISGTNTGDQNAGDVPVTPVGNLTSTDVQSALQELQGDIDGIADTDDQTATEVPYTNTTSGLTATNVQDALDEIEARVDTNDAKVSNVTTDLGIANKTATTLDVTSSDGTDATIPAATITEAGLLSAADKTKLDGITDTDDQTAAEVSYDNATSGLTATTVQAAVDELDAAIDALPGGHDAVTLGGTVGDTTDDTLDLTGQVLTVNLATTTTDGAMSAADKTKLDGISGTNTGDEVSATTTVEGIGEIATQTEVNTGTDTTRWVTPDTLEDKTYGTFTGDVLTDNATLKTLLQELETAIEANQGLVTKSGIVASGSFTGNPRKATVVFATAFADNLYSITITGEDSRMWSIESKTASGFTINANSASAIMGNTFWQAIESGES